LNGQYDVICYEKGFVCFDDVNASLYRSVIVNPGKQQVCCFSPPKSVSMDHFLRDTRNVDTSSNFSGGSATFEVSSEGGFVAKRLEPQSGSVRFLHSFPRIGKADSEETDQPPLPASASDTIPDDVVVNEIIEGSMINLWYDHAIQSWEISTKTSLGGDYVYCRSSLSDGADTEPEKLSMDETGFIGNKTYRQMFLEAITTEFVDLNDLFRWPKNCSYSFVLQHPQNKLVIQVNQPRLYLIAVYEIDGIHVKVIPSKTYLTWDCLRQPWIYYPSTFSCTGLKYSDLIRTYSTIHGSTDIVGVMCTNTVTGMRTKIINTVYIELKEIRGTNSNLLYLFFTLMYMDKIDHYLNIFPWYSNAFAKYRSLLQKWVDNISISYKSRYVKRTGEIISHRYMPHVYKLHHSIYLPSVASGTKCIITKKIIQNYLHQFTPTELFHTIFA